ncbi:MAG: hypothetical protein HQM08_10005 [Candidatus Riflebacteria bacterium]|nr:hypothetical protein [Candidatus Riflebacteria bacterium]
MNSFEIEVKEIRNTQIIQIKGYFSADAGKNVNDLIDDLLRKNKLDFIIDFSVCKLINSPGVVALMDSTMKIVDDYKGKLFFIGVDDLKVSVFKMAGVFPLAGKATSLDEALLKIKGK